MALIERLMKTDLITCKANENVREVAKRMAGNGVGAVLVVEGSGEDAKLLGLFSERDLLQRVVVAGLDPDATQLQSVMTSDPTTVTPDTHIRDCAELIRKSGFRHVPVVQGSRPVGILSVRDFQTHVVHGLESLFDGERYRAALEAGQDPYDHLGGGYEV